MVEYPTAFQHRVAAEVEALPAGAALDSKRHADPLLPFLI